MYGASTFAVDGRLEELMLFVGELRVGLVQDLERLREGVRFDIGGLGQLRIEAAVS
jgi:hypothetical protein